MQQWRSTSIGIGIRFVLASLIIFQAALSSAAMARMDAGRLTSPAGFELVICTPDGFRTIDPAAVQSGEQPDNPGRDGGHTSNHDCGMVCCAVTAQFAARGSGEPAVPLANRLPKRQYEPSQDLQLTGSLGGLLGAPRAPPYPA